MRHLTLISRVLFITVLLSGLAGFAPFHSPSATINVTTILDEYTDPGLGTGCSLREAITAANTNSAFGGCPAGSDVDTIVLPAGTYNFSRSGADDTNINGDLDINSSLNLAGAGINLTIIDASEIDRVLSINDAYTVVISDLSIKHGLANLSDLGYGMGGAIFVSLGTVTLTRVLVAENHTVFDIDCGGISNFGYMTINDSMILSNYAGEMRLLESESSTSGGGICNWSTMDIDYTTIAENHAANRPESAAVENHVYGGSGGGIMNYGIMTIDHSLIRDNYAGNITGVRTTDPYLVIGGWGGGIFNAGQLTVSNSTITANHAGDASAPGEYESWGGSGGGIANTGGTTFLQNVTLTGNFNGSGVSYDGESGGVGLFDGTVSVHNSILKGNELRNAWCWSGSILSQDYNIWSDIACTISGTTTHNKNVNPLLNPLADNGGPTWTLSLQSGSPAIDAGDPASCYTTDQRGFFRPLDGDGNGSSSCDIGAYEYGEPLRSFVPLILKLP